LLENNIKKSFDNTERIGVIGSPSSTGQLTIDVLGTAVNKKLVGSLSIFNFNQDGQDHYALGQIVEIIMQNTWAQDPTIRGLIRKKGRIDPITERQDTHIAKMSVSSVFANKGGTIDQSILGTVPSTGTSIKILNEDVLHSLLSDYEQELFYLGLAYGTTIKMPMWFKHFGLGKAGAGEAYHIGIFGKTGSGKSILAKMIMLAYARHKSMSIFVLDPQGEFSKDLRDATPIKNTLEKTLSRKTMVYDLHTLVLTGFDLFKKILANSGFFEKLKIFHENNRERAANQIEAILRGGHGTLDSEIPPYNAYERQAFNRVWNALQTDNVLSGIYSGREGQDRVRIALQSANLDDYYQLWLKIANLFKYRGKKYAIKIKDLVKKIHDKERAVIIIDLSEMNVPSDLFWNDMTKFIVIEEFLTQINEEAKAIFKRNEMLNSLVIIDEAHRLAPREKTENEDLERVKKILIDAVRTTRKFGLGWMFISQTLSSLSKDILNQIRIYSFGFGLGWGVERQALLEIIGGQKEAITLYQLFRDPQSSLKKKEYPFMTVGPISPLSFSGSPLFFNALVYPKEFISANFENKEENASSIH
jgi:hypothetical protein